MSSFLWLTFWSFDLWNDWDCGHWTAAFSDHCFHILFEIVFFILICCFLAHCYFIEYRICCAIAFNVVLLICLQLKPLPSMIKINTLCFFKKMLNRKAYILYSDLILYSRYWIITPEVILTTFRLGSNDKKIKIWQRCIIRSWLSSSSSYSYHHSSSSYKHIPHKHT